MKKRRDDRNGINPSRRLLLKAGLVAGAQLALPRWGRAQSTLLALPKAALVLGNSRYKEAPLKNPANDARAIGEALRRMGFSVTLKLDAGRAEMATITQAYVEQLAQTKAVGLFYYAGHGVQLAWRNYMLPVDAEIDTLADIQKQAVEVNSLLEGIRRANNAMNVIILDACRDNPFGSLKGLDQKGLSQMDAPQSTLLAYATSPGNVASDGTGEHGLYTEHLLREMKVPEAKVEDVFKRVRLGVRRKTNGAQIPWESTSLEEDFYFLPPAHLRKLSEEEEEKQFKEEMAFWEKAKAAKEPGPLEEYLQRYPSGQFSELAQLQLDTLLARQGEKRIEVASQAGNPFSQGYVRADTRFKVGDFYVYRMRDRIANSESDMRWSVTSVTNDEVIINDGAAVLDLMGNTKATPDGYRYSDQQNMPLEFYVGRKWSTRFVVHPPQASKGRRVLAEMDYRIVGRETITVPAGAFDCFKVEGRGSSWAPGAAPTELKVSAWYAPAQVRRFVALERVRTPSRWSPVSPLNERQELVAFKQS